VTARGGGALADFAAAPERAAMPPVPHALPASGLADILERVLDKGIVITGDVKISLVSVELLTIKLRLLIASVDKAMELGINWWESDPDLSSRARELERENRLLREKLSPPEAQATT
jgi:gas vesicle protein GvpA/GvpJ/GvpM family